MPDRLNLASQKLDVERLGPCCNQSWIHQLKVTLTRGDSRIVCTNCKTAMVQHRATTTWYWGGHNIFKTPENEVPGKTEGGDSIQS